MNSFSSLGVMPKKVFADFINVLASTHREFHSPHGVRGDSISNSMNKSSSSFQGENPYFPYRELLLHPLSDVIKVSSFNSPMKERNPKVCTQILGKRDATFRVQTTGSASIRIKEKEKCGFC